MKYYAVTEDPTELMHYGVKGMKWGQHIFGDKPRSAAFKRAATKLRASMKSGIKKTNANWKKASANRAAKKEANKNFKEAQFNAKAQARLDEALGTQANKVIRKEQAAIRREVRQERAAERREDRMMQRYLQKARHGTLKYKHLRDDQIANISERLNLENQARRLSGNETPHMLTRIKRSIGEGVVRGVGSAVAVGIEENARAKARYKAEQKYGKKTAKLNAREQTIKDRERAKSAQRNAQREARAEADKEFYKMQAESGERRTVNQVVGLKARQNRMRELANYNARQKDSEFRKRIAENITKRGDKEQTADYVRRVMSGDWREKIGYTGYAPDPKARVTFRSQVKTMAKTLATTPHRSQFFVTAPPQSSQGTNVYVELSNPNIVDKPIVKRRRPQYKGHLQTRYDLFGV